MKHQRRNGVRAQERCTTGGETWIHFVMKEAEEILSEIKQACKLNSDRIPLR